MLHLLPTHNNEDELPPLLGTHPLPRLPTTPPFPCLSVLYTWLSRKVIAPHGLESIAPVRCAAWPKRDLNGTMSPALTVGGLVKLAVATPTGRAAGNVCAVGPSPLPVVAGHCVKGPDRNHERRASAVRVVVDLDCSGRCSARGCQEVEDRRGE